MENASAARLGALQSDKRTLHPASIFSMVIAMALGSPENFNKSYVWRCPQGAYGSLVGMQASEHKSCETVRSDIIYSS